MRLTDAGLACAVNSRSNGLQRALASLLMRLCCISALSGSRASVLTYLRVDAGQSNPSKALCKCLHARLLLLCGALHGQRTVTADLLDRIYNIVLLASQVADHMVIAAATQALFTQLPNVLTTDRVDFTALYNLDGEAGSTGADHAALRVEGSVNGAVARWVARDGTNAPKMPWKCATPEGVALARGLVERCVRDMRAELDAMAADGSIADASHAPRLRLRRAVVLIDAASKCAKCSGPWGRRDPAAGGVQGDAEAEVDSISVSMRAQAGWEGCTVEKDALEAALLVAAKSDAGNLWALAMAVHMLEVRHAPSNSRVMP